MSDPSVPYEELGAFISKLSKTSEYETWKERACGDTLLRPFRLSTAKDEVKEPKAPLVWIKGSSTFIPVYSIIKVEYRVVHLILVGY